MSNRRQFLAAASAAGLAALSAGVPADATVRRRRNPSLTFYGAVGRVSGSCHLLETSRGLYLIDCGLFMSDTPDRDENASFPFDPKEVRAVFLTHAHADHNGRLPLLVKQGFGGPIYCTDATRDLNRATLRSSLTVGEGEGRSLYGRRDQQKSFELVEVVPYNRRLSKSGVDCRYTDAGHILGSAMIEIWADGRKILFSGDMGPDGAPLLCDPTQHRDADAVLFESTYGAVRGAAANYEAFGRRVRAVLDRGGSLLLPTFALHKTQTLIHLFHGLREDGVIPRDVPVFCDSPSAQQATAIYDAFPQYLDPAAKAARAARGGTLFYRPGFYEARDDDTLLTHGNGPAIYLSTSGMLDHAAAPKHLSRLAEDPRNAVFLIGYQAPGSVGHRVRSGESPMRLPIEERFGPTRYDVRELKLEVDTLSGFSSHAKGQQILNWLGGFDSVGPAYVVHGDPDRAAEMAAGATAMGVQAHAPREGQSFEVTGERFAPGPAPTLPERRADDFAELDS
ncbi:MBL fold metallo-hydrolase [Alienimonas californiensis]|uniref:Ribonuclease n=1 Tax=Alienimonas californiensis TaxID=2527989 RepID=A0A517P3U4_9PLAN|nr:MBL fold metallo-hydrolase [Alienimonas californiensis]QDT14041.1 Ribonuclease [Alienimonas californiensis]